MAKLKSRSVNASGFLASYSLKEVIPISNHGIPVRSGEVDVEEVNDRHYVILSHWGSIFDWNRWLEDPVRHKIASDMQPFLEEPENHTIYKLRKDDTPPFLL